MIDRTELHALADNELSTERATELRRALLDSPEAEAEFRAILSLKSRLSRLDPIECGDAWLGCVGRIHELDRTKRVESVVGRYSWALCGLFFMFILLGGVANRGLTGSRVRSEDIAQMATNLVPTRTPRSQDGDAMSAYLDALLGQARQSLAPDRLQVVAGAVGEVNGRHLTRLTLRDANGDISLLIVSGEIDFVGMPTADMQGRRVHVGSLDGLNCIAWTTPAYSAVLAGNRPYENLAATASRLTIR